LSRISSCRMRRGVTQAPDGGTDTSRRTAEHRPTDAASDLIAKGKGLRLETSDDLALRQPKAQN
jgi:hypothetical protein